MAPNRDQVKGRIKTREQDDPELDDALQSARDLSDQENLNKKNELERNDILLPRSRPVLECSVSLGCSAKISPLTAERWRRRDLHPRGVGWKAAPRTTQSPILTKRRLPWRRENGAISILYFGCKSLICPVDSLWNFERKSSNFSPTKLTLNQRVVGSSPTSPTNDFKMLAK